MLIAKLVNTARSIFMMILTFSLTDAVTVFLLLFELHNTGIHLAYDSAYRLSDRRHYLDTVWLIAKEIPQNPLDTWKLNRKQNCTYRLTVEQYQITRPKMTDHDQ